MPTSVVQFRKDDEVLDKLRERGINPNELGSEAFDRAVQRLLVEEAMDFLATVKARPSRPVEEIIREDRDSH